jgi:hypothetical protein
MWPASGQTELEFRAAVAKASSRSFVTIDTRLPPQHSNSPPPFSALLMPWKGQLYKLPIAPLKFIIVPPTSSKDFPFNDLTRLYLSCAGGCLPQRQTWTRRPIARFWGELLPNKGEITPATSFFRFEVDSAFDFRDTTHLRHIIQPLKLPNAKGLVTSPTYEYPSWMGLGLVKQLSVGILWRSSVGRIEDGRRRAFSLPPTKKLALQYLREMKELS